MPAPDHTIFYRTDALRDAQPTMFCTEGKYDTNTMQETKQTTLCELSVSSVQQCSSGVPAAVEYWTSGEK